MIVYPLRNLYATFKSPLRSCLKIVFRLVIGVIIQMKIVCITLKFKNLTLTVTKTGYKKKKNIPDTLRLIKLY